MTSVASSDEKRLIKHLLQKYEDMGIVGRPVNTTADTIEVQYGVGLIQILDLDEKNQVLTTNCWSRFVRYILYVTTHTCTFIRTCTVYVYKSHVY